MPDLIYTQCAILRPTTTDLKTVQVSGMPTEN